MKSDPVVDEVRKIREAYARRHNFDLNAIADDLRQKERQHADRLISYPAKPAEKKRTA